MLIRSTSETRRGIAGYSPWPLRQDAVSRQVTFAARSLAKTLFDNALRFATGGLESRRQAVLAVHRLKVLSLPTSFCLFSEDV